MPRISILSRQRRVCTVGDLRVHLGVDASPDGVSATHLSRRLFKDTECGASVSVKPVGGEWEHNGSRVLFADDTVLESVILSTIVEGSDAEGSVLLPHGATEQEYNHAVADLEAFALEAWREAEAEAEANDCGGEGGEDCQCAECERLGLDAAKEQERQWMDWRP